MSQKRLLIDARMLKSSGIGTYLQGLLEGIRRRDSFPYSISLIVKPEDQTEGPWSLKTLSCPIYSIREQYLVPWLARQTDAALLHSPHYNMPWAMASKTIVTVHDLIHLKFPEYWPSAAARAYAHFFFYHVIPKARAVLTVSENTKRDLMEMLRIPEERITVAYPAVSHDRFQNIDAVSAAAFDRLGLPKNYLLYVGNLKEFKNVPRLVDAYRQLKAKRHDIPALVLVGRNFIPGFERVIMNTPGVFSVGEIDKSLLPSFYKNASVFVYPSLYEGFGLPPLEAMASGTPVICSSRASLPEVVGDAALLIDPEKTEDLAAAMEKMISDSDLRKTLAAKGLRQAATFSWDAMTQKTLEAYDRCLV